MKALHQERLLAFLEDILFDRAIEIGIGESSEPFLEGAKSKIELSLRISFCRLPAVPSGKCPLGQIRLFSVAEPKWPQCPKGSIIDDFLADCLRGAARGVTPVVDVTLLQLAHERASADLAREQSAEHEVVLDEFCVGLARQDSSDPLEGRWTDERVVDASECLPSQAKSDEPH